MKWLVRGLLLKSCGSSWTVFKCKKIFLMSFLPYSYAHPLKYYHSCVFAYKLTFNNLFQISNLWPPRPWKLYPSFFVSESSCLRLTKVSSAMCIQVESVWKLYSFLEDSWVSRLSTVQQQSLLMRPADAQICSGCPTDTLWINWLNTWSPSGRWRFN